MTSKAANLRRAQFTFDLRREHVMMRVKPVIGFFAIGA